MWNVMYFLIFPSSILTKPFCNLYTGSCDSSATSSNTYDSSQFSLVTDSSTISMGGCVCIHEHWCQPDISQFSRDLFNGYKCSGSQICCPLDNLIYEQTSGVISSSKTSTCGIRLSSSGNNYYGFSRDSRIQISNIDTGRENFNSNNNYGSNSYDTAHSNNIRTFGNNNYSPNLGDNSNKFNSGYKDGSTSNGYGFDVSQNLYNTEESISQFARILDEPGNHAEFGEFPWQVAIVARNYTYICGGVLVHRYWVVTAAHCVNRLISSDVLIRLGQRSISGNGDPQYQETQVAQIILHPRFNEKRLENDIALLQLHTAALKKTYINPICLPSSNTDFSGMRCVVTGWGKKQPNGDYSESLKKNDVPVVTNSECQRRYQLSLELGNNFRLHSSFLCAGERNKDACKGDGGSPLACQLHGVFILAGIVSWGIGCGDGYPGVYTRVASFVRWINAYINMYVHKFRTSDSSFERNFDYDGLHPSETSYTNLNRSPIERNFYDYDYPTISKDSNSEYDILSNPGIDHLNKKLTIPTSKYKLDYSIHDNRKPVDSLSVSSPKY